MRPRVFGNCDALSPRMQLLRMRRVCWAFHVSRLADTLHSGVTRPVHWSAQA